MKPNYVIKHYLTSDLPVFIIVGNYEGANRVCLYSRKLALRNKDKNLIGRWRIKYKENARPSA